MQMFEQEMQEQLNCKLFEEWLSISSPNFVPIGIVLAIYPLSSGDKNQVEKGTSNKL